MVRHKTHALRERSATRHSGHEVSDRCSCAHDSCQQGYDRIIQLDSQEDWGSKSPTHDIVILRKPEFILTTLPVPAYILHLIGQRDPGLSLLVGV